MERASEAVGFLTASNNRLAVLTALRDRRMGQKGIEDRVGVSRSTVARILHDAESMGWVRSQGSEYWLSPMGRAILSEVTACLETVDVLQSIGPRIDGFPAELLDSVEIRALADARITETSIEDPTAPFARSLALFRRAESYQGLTKTSLPEHARVLQEGVGRGRLEFEHIIERQFVEDLRGDADRWPVWEFLADSVLVYDGEVPLNLHIVDGTVLVWFGGADGTQVGLIESDDPAVLDWARSLHAKYKSESEYLSRMPSAGHDGYSVE